MSKYTLQYTVREGSRIVFESSSAEEAETMLEEFRICEMAAEAELFSNQSCEFD